MRVAPVTALRLILAGAVGLSQIPAAYARGPQSSPAPISAEPLTAGNSISVSPDYVIGPGDIVKISVWQEPQFDETVQVRPDGKISLPLISDVDVSGLTPNAAQTRVAAMLAGYLKHPMVSVVVTEVHSRIVYVVGAVSRPGPYPMFGPLDVEQLIARAGGVTRKADRKHVYVLRAGSNSRQRVNYKKVLQGNPKAHDLQLNPGDTVVVP